MNHLNNHSVSALMLGTLTVAALHALLPSHWLAFALVGRAQRWPMHRTLRITVLAGSGHALLTMVLGLLVAGAGKELQRAIPPQLEHAATGGILILLGLYFLAPALRGHSTACDHPGHHHAESGEESGPAPGPLARRLGSTPTALGALAIGMTLSPCLDLLSVYVAASALSWSLLLLISLLLAATTVGIMALLVWLALHGLQMLRLTWLERNEGSIVGLLLIALGILLFFL